MQRFWKKASVINKLIISYVLLLLLPSFIIWGYLFPQMQQRMIDNTLNNQEYNIARLSGAIDMHLSTLVADSVTFAANPELSPYAIKRNTMGEYEAVREIRKVLTPSGLVSQFFFFLKENGRFYTNTNVYPFSWLTNTQYGYCYLDWPKDDMWQTLQSLKTLTVRPLERAQYPNNYPENIITVIVPIPMNSNSPYAVLLAWINESTLNSLISPVREKTYDSTFIYDASGQRIYSSNREAISIEDKLLDELVWNQKTNGANLVTFRGKNYVYASSVQGSTAWRCVSLVPLSNLMEEISSMRWNLLFIFSLIIITSAIIIFIGVRVHYLPIKALASKAVQYVEPGKPHNEFDIVHNALDHLNTQATLLQSRLRDNLPVLREHQLYSLVGGQYLTIEEFHLAAADIGISLPYPYLSTALIRTDAPDSTDVIDYLEQLMHNSPSGMTGYFLPAFNRQDILFVSSMNTQDSIQIFLKDINADISATFRCKVYAAVGRVVIKAGDLRLSYSDAAAVLDKMALMGWSGVEKSDEGTGDCAADISYLLYQFDFAVAKSDILQIQVCLDNLTSRFEKNDGNVSMAYTAYQHVANSLQLGMDTFGVDADKYTSLNMAPEDMKFSDMKANLHKLVDDYIQTLNADQGKFEVSIDEIRAYIEQTCLKYEFSIQNVAEYFHMSYSGFSHYFKRTTGVSCKKYVDEYRTEQAIERIMNSLDSLDTIAQDVGFANASSFIRSFKKITGRTPGSYRNL